MTLSTHLRLTVLFASSLGFAAACQSAQIPTEPASSTPSTAAVPPGPPPPVPTSVPTVDAALVPIDADASPADAGAESSVDSGSSEDAAAPPRSLIEVHPLAPGYPCEFGGSEIVTGLDDGRGLGIAGDGILNGQEVRQRRHLCDAVAPAPSPVGLDALPVNSTCKVPDGPSRSEGVELERVFANIQLDLPVSMKQRPALPNRYFVVELGGKIKTFNRGDNSSSVALDLTRVVYTGYEPGLLQVAFHPTRPEAYVSYTRKSSIPGVRTALTVSRFRFVAGSDFLLDPQSEEVLLSLPKQHDEHNGGGAEFGPDGMLYVAVGDDDDVPSANAQNPYSLFGKFLRIDVTKVPAPGKAYAIPTDNPYVGGGGAPEVWALGFRNPWRWSFDAATGKLFVGDVGGAAYEEIDVVEKGKNYGWGVMEGNHCRDGEITSEVGCNKMLYEPPVAEYKHAEGCSVTGGFVARNPMLPSIQGQFLYADFCQGMIWGIDAAKPTDPRRWIMSSTRGAQAFDSISSFALDAAGELYVLGMGGWGTPGTIHKVVPVNSQKPAAKLSQSGCVNSANPALPAAGAIPYTVNAPFFSEAEIYKERFLYLPPGGKLFVGGDGRLVTPPGAVLMKTFRDGPKMIETRLMMQHADGEWTGWSYRWNDAQTDADLLEGSATTLLQSGDTWTYPDRGACVHCHTRPTARTLGLEVAQFNRTSYYPSTGRWANQLSTLQAIGAFQNTLPAEPIRLPALARPSDPNAPLASRARAYLHTNCAGCHQPGGGGYGNADYRFEKTLAQTNVCNATPIVTAFGIPDGKLIPPGAPSRSVLLRRLSVNDAHRMNPYRSSVDTAGITLLQTWIGSLTDCSER
jgi:uncharacterized repeat protein (TIGR03806 family)